jgi:hypothetical protein
MPRYVGLLCKVFDQAADELGLVGSSRPATIEGADVDRRHFLQFMAFMGSSPMLDWDRFPALLAGLRQVDASLLDGLESLTDFFARQSRTTAPRSLLPAIHSHLATLKALLRDSQPEGLDRRLNVLLGQTAVIAGRLWYAIGNMGEAQSWFSIGKAAARESGDGPLQAFELVARSSLCSRVKPGGLDAAGSSRLVLELLNEAEAALGANPPALQYAWTLARRAEDRAALKDADGANSDLERAERVLVTAEGSSGVELFSHFDSTRLDGYRGKCAVLLASPDAVSILESALARSNPALVKIRAAMLIDLAVACAQQSEPDRACSLLSESFTLADTAGLTAMQSLIAPIRDQYLGSWPELTCVRDLDDRLRTAPLAGVSCTWAT